MRIGTLISVVAVVAAMLALVLLAPDAAVDLAYLG